MFEAEFFDHYTPDSVPLNRDVYLRDESFMAEYEASMIEGVSTQNFRHVGWVAFAAVRGVTPTSLDVSIFINFHDRVHELVVSLPRDQIVACVGAWRWDENPSIFVKSGWIEAIYRRTHCVFGMIDAIDVRKALESGESKFRDLLPRLREGIDVVAARHPKVLFLSFADSVILKSHWQAGFMGERKGELYDPEAFLEVFRDVRVVFRDVLGLGVYGVITQGMNEYGDASLSHVSATGNHLCVNSLGAPFADLLSIDAEARAAIRAKCHAPHELYLDELFFSSLRIKDHEAKRLRPRHAYVTALRRTSATYVCADCDELVAGLRSESS
jgi:hypothetical protein